MSPFFFIQCSVDSFDDEDEVNIKAIFTGNDSVTGVTIKCGECVDFEDVSSGIILSRLWDFEGGSPSTSFDFRVRVCYDTPGKYDVSLSVNANEDSSTKADFVCVEAKEQEPLKANFSADRTRLPVGGSVAFTDESEGLPDTWKWEVYDEANPGDKMTSNEQNPVFTIINPGSFTVSLTIERDGASDTEVKPNFIGIVPIEDIICHVLSSTSSSGTRSDYSYSDSLLVRIDRFRIDDGSLTSYSTFSWNSNGLLEQRENRDANDVLTGGEEYEYDQFELRRQRIYGPGNSTIFDYTFFHEQGRIISAQVESLGSLPTKDMYDYDEAGKNIIRQRSLFDGSEIGRIEWTFDDNPNVFRDIPFLRFPSRFNQNNVTQTTSYDDNDEIISQQTSTYVYNEFGRPNRAIRTVEDETTEITFEMNCNF